VLAVKEPGKKNLRFLNSYLKTYFGKIIQV